MKNLIKVVSILAVLVSLALPVSGAVFAAAPAQVSNKATYSAFDFGYNGPDTLTAGWNRIKLVNQGKEMHQIQFIRLLDGKTAQDLFAAFAGVLPSWAVLYGGPNVTMPGNSTQAWVMLDPGSYVILCAIPDDETGQPHALLGMWKVVNVVEGNAVAQSEPVPSISITQKNFNFEVSGQLKPGNRIIRVDNMGTEAHEAVLVKLLPGKTIFDWVASFAPGSQPAGSGAGGITGIMPGMHQYVRAKLEAGNYGLVCFFEDPVTKLPHFLLGMTAEFTVAP